MSGLIRSFEHDFGALVKKQGDKTAVIVPAEIDSLNISYNQLQVLTERCLRFYSEHNLQPGDVIFSLMPNSAETLVLFLCAILGGYGFAPLPCVASRREIERWISLVKPKLCVTTDLITKEGEAALLESRIPTQSIVTDLQFAWLPQAPPAAAKAEGAKIYLSTSGTTGEPKAMVIDANRLWSSGHAFMKFHGLKD